MMDRTRRTGSIQPADVQARGLFGRCPKGIFGRAHVDAGQSLALHDQTDTGLRPVDEGGGAVDDPAHRSLARSNDLEAADDGAQPMRVIDDLGAADAREEVLVAAGEADDLVGKGGAADQQVVIVVNGSIDGNRNVAQQPRVMGQLRQQGAGNLLDLRPGNGTEGGECGGIVPEVIQEADLRIAAVSLCRGDSHEPVQFIRRQRRVGAQRNQEIELLDAPEELLAQQAEQHRERDAARAVRYDHQRASARQVPRGQSPLEHLANGVLGQQSRIIPSLCVHGSNSTISLKATVDRQDRSGHEGRSG